MRPCRATPAHQTGALAELVCTNSFKSERPGQRPRPAEAGDGGAGLRAPGTPPTRAASPRDPPWQWTAPSSPGPCPDASRPTPRVALVRREVRSLPPGPAVVATGPLTSPALAAAVAAELGDDGLAFYDAIAPIVHVDSLNREIVFAAGRFGEDADYLNCPMTEREYRTFVDALAAADVYPGHEWEKIPYFEGCLPVEVMARRGRDTLRFGPMKPIGPDRSPHRRTAPRRRPAQAGRPGRPDVEPRRLSDPLANRRATAGLRHGSRAWGG